MALIGKIILKNAKTDGYGLLVLEIIVVKKIILEIMMLRGVVLETLRFSFLR